MMRMRNTILTYAITGCLKASMWIAEKSSKTCKTWERYHTLRDIEDSGIRFYNTIHFCNVSDRARDKYIAELRKFMTYVNSYGNGFLM